MGWSYRKSVSIGPIRINLSKSGVGYSVGGRGFRTGIRANGRRYSRYTLPGTGMSYYQGQDRTSRGPATTSGCAIVLAVLGTLIAASMLPLIA
jgi:hypothetical protein